MSNDFTDETIITPIDIEQEQIPDGITFGTPITNRVDEVDIENGAQQYESTTPLGYPEINLYSTQHRQSKNEVIILNPLPIGGSGPVGNYYAEIHWNNGFEQWSLVRFSTPMDGSCLFHAISNSFFSPYHSEILHGKHVSRNKMVAALRKELSQKLASKISTDPDAPSYYDILNGGNTSAFAEAVPEFNLDYMQKQLDSNTPIGYGYMEFIGNALNKDIYILEALRHDIYVTDELPLTIKGNRNSIVLYYMNGHYELLGIKNQNGSFDTHFTPNHSFIRFLYNRVRQITE